MISKVLRYDNLTVKIQITCPSVLDDLVPQTKYKLMHKYPHIVVRLHMIYMEACLSLNWLILLD